MERIRICEYSGSLLFYSVYILNFVFLPVSTATLQLYGQFLSRSFKSIDSIKNYVSGVKTMHLY